MVPIFRFQLVKVPKYSCAGFHQARAKAKMNFLLHDSHSFRTYID